MNYPSLILALFVTLLMDFSLPAQLSITIGPAKSAGQKAVVPLTIKNNLREQVVSARAVMFLLDSQGKVIGQANRFIIGGDTNHPPLLVGATNTYHFAIPTAGKPFVTNRLTITNVRLTGGRTANPVTDVEVRAIPLSK